MKISYTIELLKAKYDALYNQWCLENPGKVGCNYGTKAWALNNLLVDELDLEGIKLKRDWYLQHSKNPYVTVEVLDEVINLIEKNEKN